MSLRCVAFVVVLEAVVDRDDVEDDGVDALDATVAARCGGSCW